MTIDTAIRGSLFAPDFLNEPESIGELPEWDDLDAATLDRRLYLREKLDALFFHLYGITHRDDVRYVYSTFPIVKRQKTAAYRGYRSRDLCLAWMNALAAGRPDANVNG